jgi:hypothetical protein
MAHIMRDLRYRANLLSAMAVALERGEQRGHLALGQMLPDSGDIVRPPSKQWFLTRPV